MGSYSSIRAVSAMLLRFTNRIPTKSVTSWNRRSLTSAVSISWSPCFPLYQFNFSFDQCRSVSTFPVCMSRRSSKIAGRKEANDAKKAKLYSRIGKGVVSARSKSDVKIRYQGDQLLDIALDAGAEDVIKPSTSKDDIDEDRSHKYYKIVSSTENYAGILSKLWEEGIEFETDNGSELIPITPVEVDNEAMELNRELMAKLLELDDVDAVYTNQM